MTGRAPMAALSLPRFSSSIGGAGTSNIIICGSSFTARRYQLAVALTITPNWVRRRSNRDSSAPITPERHAHNGGADVPAYRPLTMIIGMRRCAEAKIRFGALQIGFDEQCQIRTPVIEEARDVAWCIERNELMQRAGRQPGFRKSRRRDGAGRD